MNLEKVKNNTEVIVNLASKYGISVTGVTKGVCGDPSVATAMVEGGVSSLADSRIENIKRLRIGGIRDIEIGLLRPPMLSEVRDVVEYTDWSINTELSTLKKLSDVAMEHGKVHKVLLLVEMGERRDGILPEELDGFIETALTYEGITINGMAMNLTCLTGVIPTRKKINEFDSIVTHVEDTFGIKLNVVSGGNSANIPLLLRGEHPPNSRINNIRVGEAILLGRDTVKRNVIPGASPDAFKIRAEIIEAKKKPAKPDGMLGENAFGEAIDFQSLEKISNIYRAILALGRQDIEPNGITLDTGEILWSSSDHTVIWKIPSTLTVGDTITFNIRTYAALLKAFTAARAGYLDIEYT
ncbi:alanine racemase [Thermococcus sp.]